MKSFCSIHLAALGRKCARKILAVELLLSSLSSQSSRPLELDETEHHHPLRAAPHLLLGAERGRLLEGGEGRVTGPDEAEVGLHTRTPVINHGGEVTGDNNIK